MTRIPEYWRMVQQGGITRGIEAEGVKVNFENPGERIVYRIKGRPRRYILGVNGELIPLDEEHERQVKNMNLIIKK